MSPHRHPMHILLVEDDSTIARELQLRWRAQGWLPVAADTLAAASEVLETGHVDLIVLDLQLPDGDGMPWLRQLRRLGVKTPVLVLTARDAVSDRVAGLQSGADDYLVKPFAADELDARLKVLQRRVLMDRGEHAGFGPLVWLQEEGRVLSNGRPLELLPREFEVLGLLVRRAPRVVPKRALIDALAERNLEVGDSAAEVYMSRLRRKLVGSGVKIHTVRGFGYRLMLEAEPGQEPMDRQ